LRDRVEQLFEVLDATLGFVSRLLPESVDVARLVEYCRQEGGGGQLVGGACQVVHQVDELRDALDGRRARQDRVDLPQRVGERTSVTLSPSGEVLLAGAAD